MIGLTQHSPTDENHYNGHHYYHYLNDDVVDDDDHPHHHDDLFQGGGTSWQEGMNSISDVIHPDLTSPQKGEKLPTLLLPWRGGSGLGSRINNNNTNKKMNGRGNGAGAGGATSSGNGLSRLTSTPLSRNNRGLNGRE